LPPVRTHRTRSVPYVLSIVAIVAAIATFLPTTPANAALIASPVARTDKGLIRGTRVGDVREFLGVPYAAPPVGSLRWRPPQPAASWRGVRDATHFGAH